MPRVLNKYAASDHAGQGLILALDFASLGFDLTLTAGEQETVAEELT